MGFDINKYNNKRFHSDELIHKRIKALLLWYEYQVYQQELSFNKQVLLLNNIINICIEQEWYEIATFFRDERLKIVKVK